MAANTDHLLPNELLRADQFLSSLNGRFTLIYQGDGNLVLYKNYRNGTRKWLWDSETNGRPCDACIMQGDGNLVIYGPGGEYIWDTATDGQPGSRLVVQDDGNVAIYRPDGTPIWATNTVQRTVPSGPRAQGDDMQPGEVLNSGQSISSQNGNYTLTYQDDGNLVLYRNFDKRPLWASNTGGKPDEVCIMQGDGNLVIYGPDGEAFWSTATHGHPGSRLVVQDDGDVVIYNTNNQRIWSTDTLPPVVSNFTPTAGEAGDSVIIKGKNFVKVQRVLFGNSTARYTVNSRTTITATVPDNPHSGPISIITPVASAMSITSFTAVATRPPIIDSFSPSKGKIGTGITISGKNLSRVIAVQFNGINASFKIESDEKITATVPANATDGPITVTNRGGSVISRSNFDVEIAIPPANLHITGTWMQPNAFPTPGSPFTVYFSWFNGGGTATGDFTIRLQLDNGARYTDIAASSYAPGTGDFVYWTFPAGLPAGSYVVYAILDFFNQVAEVSEGDNISLHGFIVRQA